MPLALEELWREACSGVWFEGYELLHPQSITKMLSDVDAPYVPFARDIDDALLVVGDDAVYEYEMGEGRGDRPNRLLLTGYEAYRNKLLEGRLNTWTATGQRRDDGVGFSSGEINLGTVLAYAAPRSSAARGVVAVVAP